MGLRFGEYLVPSRRPRAPVEPVDPADPVGAPLQISHVIPQRVSWITPLKPRNINDLISKFKKLTWELRATFMGKRAES